LDVDEDDLEIKLVVDNTDTFVVVNGVKVARRGDKGTPQAKTWISLEPGWRVLDGRGGTLAVEYTSPRVQ
jgi:uncharacterized Zn-binding protein involved in type VI secretion